MEGAGEASELELGLNEHHKQQLVDFLHFCRYQRSQKLRTVAACFENARETRFLEPTYTSDEILEILSEVEKQVRDEVEGELMHMTRTSVLLLQTVFLQAQEWHLKLQADTAQLENMELLEKMKRFEEAEMAFGMRDPNALPGGSASRPQGKLNPILDTGAGPAKLLKAEIDRISEENTELRERVKALEEKATSVLKEKTILNRDLEKANQELNLLKEERQMETKLVSSELEQVKSELEQLKVSFTAQSASGEDNAEKQHMESDLKATKLRLLKIQEELDIKEKELDKKLRESTAFANLKRMLETKNEIIQELRAKLRGFEPSEECPEDD